MKWQSLRPGFFVCEDFFSPEEARDHLITILKDGEDPARGFHHPHVKPNRFHPNPKYPVQRYMGLGLYWNPVDYSYRPRMPDGTTPFAIPEWLQQTARRIVAATLPLQLPFWRAESALVNYYLSGDKMGMHVDKEEEDQVAAVVGLCFGGTCRFLYEDEAGNEASFMLPGNSAYCFGGPARSMRHGVGTTYKNTLAPGSSGLLQDKERLSVTLRKVKR